MGGGGELAHRLLHWTLIAHTRLFERLLIPGVILLEGGHTPVLILGSRQPVPHIKKGEPCIHFPSAVRLQLKCTLTPLTMTLVRYIGCWCSIDLGSGIPLTLSI